MDNKMATVVQWKYVSSEWCLLGQAYGPGGSEDSVAHLERDLKVMVDNSMKTVTQQWKKAISMLEMRWRII